MLLCRWNVLSFRGSGIRGSGIRGSGIRGSGIREDKHLQGFCGQVTLHVAMPLECTMSFLESNYMTVSIHCLNVTLWSDWLVWMWLFDLIGWYGHHSWYQEHWVEYTRNVLNFTSGYNSIVGCPWGKTVQPFYMNKQSTNPISLKKIRPRRFVKSPPVYMHVASVNTAVHI